MSGATAMVINDAMDRAIKKESEALDQLQTIEKITIIDEEKLKELNLAHLKHPWLE